MPIGPGGYRSPRRRRGVGMSEERSKTDASGSGAPPGGLEPLPKLWKHVNDSADSDRPFDTNVPLPIPEPPRNLPGIDEPRSSVPGSGLAPLPPLGSQPGMSADPRVSQLGGHPAPGGDGPEVDDSEDDDDSVGFRPARSHIAAAAIVVIALLGGAMMLLGGGDDEGGAAPPRSTGAPVTTKAPAGIEAPVSTLNPGDCILLGEYDIADPFVLNVLIVPCENDHDAEVIETVTTPMDLHREIAPVDLESATQFLCGPQFGAYVGEDFLTSELQLAPLVGTRRSLVICTVRHPAGTMFVGAIGSVPSTTVSHGS